MVFIWKSFENREKFLKNLLNFFSRKKWIKLIVNCYMYGACTTKHVESEFWNIHAVFIVISSRFRF